MLTKQTARRILVVDDDKILRSYILSLLRESLIGDWTFFEAFDGLLAMEILDREDIGIVLTDMRMTHMHGWELIKAAKAKWPWIQFIVLSNYDDFDYVKKSFLYGIVDYLLKFQLEKDTLSSRVEAAQAVLNEYAAKAEYEENRRRAMRMEDAWALGNQMHRMIEEEKPFDLPGFSGGEPLTAVRLNCLPADPTPPEEDATGYLSLASAYVELLHAQAGGSALAPRPYLLPIDAQSGMLRFGALMRTRDKDSILSMKALFQPFFAEASARGVLVYAAHGALSDFRLPELTELEARIDLSFYGDASGWIEDGPPGTEILSAEDTVTDFVNALVRGRSDAAVQILRAFAAKLQALRLPSRTARKHLIQFVWALNTATKGRIDPQPFLHVQRLTPFAEALCDAVRAHAQPLPAREAGENAALSELIRQVTDDLAHPISLEAAARRIGFSRSHFCRLFREATGESYNAFLTRVRMERACALLSVPGVRDKCVAQAVGIPDVQYFRKVFHQYTGVSSQTYAMRGNGRNRA
jgi:two-component system response regulator YesN